MNNRYAEVVNWETARAIYTALDFCDREGFSNLARRLRVSPAVVKMFAQYPRKKS